MTVLITRPAPECDQLAAQLNQVAISAIAQPLLEVQQGKYINKLIEQIQQLQQGDYIIAVSYHAVRFATDYLISQGAEWPKNMHYIAVGDKTAAALAQACQQPVSSPQGQHDSEALLALPELANIRQRRVLILRGNGGRELIYQALTARQAQVSYCETYQRNWLTLDATRLAQQWQQQQIHALVVTSSEQLIYLTGLIPTEDLAWLYNCHLFVPSRRIADQASTLGYKHISTVGSAANQALFTFLKSNVS